MKSILPIALCLIPFLGGAQPVVTGALDFQPGDILIYEKMQTTNPGPSGASQTWDFSSLSPVGGDTNWYYCLTPSPNAPTPAANLVVVGSDGTYLYYDNKSGYGDLVAIADSSNSPVLTIVYQDPVKIIERPLTYPSSFIDSCKESYQIEYMGNTSTISGEGAHTSLVDGYGTLILSDTTYADVLRVRSEIQQTDVIQGLGVDIEIKRTSYLWYVDGVKAPVLRLDSTTVSSMLFSDDRFTMERLLHGEPTSVALLSAGSSLKAYFQGNDLVLLPEFSQSTMVDLDLINLQGQKIQSGTYGLQNGMQRIPLHQDLAPGLYLLRWKADDNNSGRIIKLVK